METWSNNLAANTVAIAPQPTSVASNSNHLSRSPTHAPTKRKGIACKECRQGKLKCERSNLQTCSRCKSLRLLCVYDNDYKRYNKRSKLRELTDEIERLRATKARAINQSPLLQQDRTPSQQGDAGSDDLQTSNEASSMRLETTSPDFLTTPALHEDLNCQQELCPALYPQTLSNTTLSGVQITRLFQNFVRDYQPHLPIFEVQISPDECFLQSPLLFWTIIAIASRKDDEEFTILASLAPAIQSLLWQTVGKPPHSTFDLKAMILICLWPFPTSSMSTDSSYILAAASKSCAMHIGLHRPHFIQDFSRVKTSFRPEELKDALIIWSACFIAAENITSTIGQDPLFITDSTLDMICNSNNSYKIPLDLYHLVLIWRFCNRLHRVMASRERRLGSLSESDSGVLLPLHEGELDQLQQQLGSSLSKNNEIIFLYASLQLRCYYFLERRVKTPLKEGILKAYRSALNIIWKSQDMELEARLLSYGPSMFSNAVAIASTFTLRILRSSYSELVDVEEGRKAFNLSLSLLRKCSVEDNDLSGRFSKILAQLWSSTPEESSPQMGLRVTTRLGGSLLHDTLWKWREKYGGQSPTSLGSRTSPASVIRAAESGNPALTDTSDSRSTRDEGVGTIAYGSMHPQRAESMAMLGEFGENDLINEINNDWLWGGGGPSSLVPMGLNPMEFALNMSNNYTNNDNLPDAS